MTPYNDIRKPMVTQKCRPLFHLKLQFVNGLHITRVKRIGIIIYIYMCVCVCVYRTLPFSSMAKSFFVLYICLQNVVPSSCGLSLSLRHEPPLLSQNTIYDDKKHILCRYVFQNIDYNN